MVTETFGFFSGAPGFSKKAINICSQHRAGVIEAKERVKTDFFQLTLAGDAGAPTPKGLMSTIREVFFEICWVVWILV